MRYVRVFILVMLTWSFGLPMFRPTWDETSRAANTYPATLFVGNVALGKPVTVTTNGVNEGHDCAGLSAADITDGSLEYKPSSWCTEDGVVGYVNDNYNELMRITITIDLQGLYRVSRIRYNTGDVQRAETWNADTMITPFGSSGTNPGSPYRGAWTEHTGDTVLSSVTVVLEKTRVSWETDWLFVGEIEVYGVITAVSTISGRVTDASGHGIPGVTVWAGFPRNTTTDASGNYTFTDLPAGTYTIRPDKEPCTFTPTTQTVTIPPGKALPDFRSVRLASGLDVCILEPGDILLKAGAPVGDYTDLIRFWIKLGGSYFTHSALYLGVTNDPQNPAQTGPRIAEAAGKKKLGGSRDDEVWETWLAGTQWWDGENVTDWAVVRPAASSVAKAIAIQYARAKAADPNVVFSFLTELDDEQEFYCSKLVWKSYQRAGVDVHRKTGLTGGLTSYWVTPEDLYFGSPVVQNMPGVDPSTRAFFRIYSPAHLTLIDPLGRRTGFDSSGGGEVNEIPGALYSGVDAQIESISVARLGSPVGWRLQATGYAAGTYTLETGYLDGRTRNWETHATTAQGKVDEYPVRRPNYPGYLPLLSR